MIELEEAEKKKKQVVRQATLGSILENNNNINAWLEKPVEEMGYEECDHQLAKLINLRNKISEASSSKDFDVPMTKTTPFCGLGMIELEEAEEKKRQLERQATLASILENNNINSWWEKPVEEMGYEECDNHLATLINIRNKFSDASSSSTDFDVPKTKTMPFCGDWSLGLNF
uniref:Uncharacterized protein n=1 Tax=Cannabis sativa TaxID=3483 RepID=A0A803NYG7_CANSA